MAAAALGACLDLYAVGSSACLGLRELEPLANGTGGALFLYPSLDAAALPQARMWLSCQTPSTACIQHLGALQVPADLMVHQHDGVTRGGVLASL